MKLFILQNTQTSVSSVDSGMHLKSYVLHVCVCAELPNCYTGTFIVNDNFRHKSESDCEVFMQSTWKTEATPQVSSAMTD